MDDLIPLLFLVFFTMLGGLLLWRVFHAVKNSIDKHKHAYNEDKFDRLAKAFIRHRDDTEKRLQNIEALITKEEPEMTSTRQLEDSPSQHSIEIESQNIRNQREGTQRENLPNMLNKRRKQS